MYQLIRIAVLLVPWGAASLAAATEMPRLPQLPLSLAQQAVTAAVQHCDRDGYAVSAAVVDRSGVLRAQVRADGAGPHTLESSLRKAYTAASLRESTQRLAELAAKDGALQGLHHMADNILLLGGGLPIVVDEVLLGGIGVGGAPGARLDEACARAGLQRILKQD